MAFNEEKLGKSVDKKKPFSGSINAYLFVNLVTVGALLIGLWTKKPVWDASIRFPNLLLLLVVVNTALIFRDVFRNKPLVSPVLKRRKSLARLRKVMHNPKNIDVSLLKKSLCILKEITNSPRIELHFVYENKGELVVGEGDVVPQLNACHMQLRQEGVQINYTGKLGNEILISQECLDSGKSVSAFKSRITGVNYCALALSLPTIQASEGMAVLLFANTAKRAVPPVSVANLVLYFELLIALVEGTKHNESLEYLDTHTGMELFSTFRDALDTELERSERYKQNLGLLAISVLGYEALTDAHKLLVHKAVGQATRQSLRRFDRVFKSDESGKYFVLLSESDLKESGLVIKRIKKIFNKETLKLQPKPAFMPVLLSGVATYPADASLAEALLELTIESLNEEIQTTQGAE